MITQDITEGGNTIGENTGRGPGMKGDPSENGGPGENGGANGNGGPNGNPPTGQPPEKPTGEKNNE